MKTLEQQLIKYAGYHRDRRNLVTHVVGIPLIVFAVVVLMSRPAWSMLDALPLSPALVAVCVAGIYYLRLDLGIGAVMSVFLLLCLLLAAPIAAAASATWLAAGVGIFVFGWVLQFIGHIYEGRKPAFVDDLMGLIIGPIFVMAEVAFMFGMRSELSLAIDAAVGPLHSGSRQSVGS
jgi:uncharacterized membrane protein YGL010W